MRTLLALSACVPALALAGRANVDEARLMASTSAQNAGQWLAQGRDHSEQRFSPLTRINDKNVGQLGLAWYGDFDTRRGQESTPLVIDGVLYVTTAWSKVYAYDAKSGKQLWKYDPRVPGEWGVNARCDVVNRGVAAWKGKLYLGTIDGRLIAIDAATGKQKWSVQTTPKDKPYSITGAPRVANANSVIFGSGNGAPWPQSIRSPGSADNNENLLFEPGAGGVDSCVCGIARDRFEE
jgi:glucose dehydrogenase